MGSSALLVSDVDNTLLGDDQGLVELADWLGDVRNRLRLAYNSGRFYGSVMESINETDLPIPDAIIGGVGTEIRVTKTGETLSDWPPADRWDAATVRSVLAEYDQLTLQPEHLISPYKISYYGRNLSGHFLDRIKGQLQAAGCDTDVVYSSHRDLDVLPAGTNKGSAAAHLVRHWAIDPAAVIVAGDSGNDLAMFQQGFRGIVVANAHPELRALTGERVFHSRSNCAAGVLEGLQHWLSAAAPC